MGLPIGLCWGFEKSADGTYDRPGNWEAGELRCPWIRYEYSSQLEFAYMILKYREYTGRDISVYLPFIRSCVQFYFEHYTKRHREISMEPWDENSKLVIFPSTALETYKDALNPADAVSGLRAALEGLCSADEPENREKYFAMLERVPELETRICEGAECIAPARSWTHIINNELPQLYPVFPYEMYGIGREGLELARDTYFHEVDKPSQRGHESWRQDIIFAARLGLAEEARRLCLFKLGGSGRRFPAFWGPGFDWVPDHNWGGSGMVGLQDMLIQSVDDRIYLFPAWLPDWDIDFRLHIPGGRAVEASMEGGKVKWSVTGGGDVTVILPDGTESRERERL
jgi:hypothetical protein